MVRDTIESEEILLETEDGHIALVDKTLVCICERDDFDLPLRGLVAFAIVLGTIVTTIVGLGFAPRPLLAITVVWFAGAVWGALVLQRRARELGRFEIDKERGELRHLRGSRPVRTTPLASVVGYAVVQDVFAVGADPRYDVAPRWVVLTLGHNGRARLGRGRPWQLGPVLRALDEAGIRHVATSRPR